MTRSISVGKCSHTSSHKRPVHGPGSVWDPVVQTGASHVAHNLVGLLTRADIPGMLITYAMIEEYNPLPKMLPSVALDITGNN